MTFFQYKDPCLYWFYSTGLFACIIHSLIHSFCTFFPEISLLIVCHISISIHCAMVLHWMFSPFLIVMLLVFWYHLVCQVLCDCGFSLSLSKRSSCNGNRSCIQHLSTQKRVLISTPFLVMWVTNALLLNSKSNTKTVQSILLYTRVYMH